MEKLKTIHYEDLPEVLNTLKKDIMRYERYKKPEQLKYILKDIEYINNCINKD